MRCKEIWKQLTFEQPPVSHVPLRENHPSQWRPCFPRSSSKPPSSSDLLFKSLLFSKSLLVHQPECACHTKLGKGEVVCEALLLSSTTGWVCPEERSDWLRGRGDAGCCSLRVQPTTEEEAVRISERGTGSSCCSCAWWWRHAVGREKQHETDPLTCILGYITITVVELYMWTQIMSVVFYTMRLCTLT